MKTHLVSKTKTAEILAEIAVKWDIQVPKIKNLMMYQIGPAEEIITGGDLKIVHVNETYLPFLSETSMLQRFPAVTVDMGAVRFMCKGANVMRPGIKSSSEFDTGQIVCIIEESQKKFLAVGVAMMSSHEMETAQKGEVINNMHYVSDRFWEAAKTIRD